MLCVSRMFAALLVNVSSNAAKVRNFWDDDFPSLQQQHPCVCSPRPKSGRSDELAAIGGEVTHTCQALQQQVVSSVLH